MEKLSPVQLNIDDESSWSILDKMEQLHCPNNSVSPHVKEIFSKTMEPNNIIQNQEQNILESNSRIDKLQCTDRVSLKSKVTRDEKSQPKNPEHPTPTDEYRDSEGDNNKVDNEDIKSSSSSENSNDTLLSLTNYKGREFDMKNAIDNTQVTSIKKLNSEAVVEASMQQALKMVQIVEVSDEVVEFDLLDR
jgi:hypothetical protein